MSEMDYTDEATASTTSVDHNDNSWAVIEEQPNEEQPHEKQPSEEQPGEEQPGEEQPGEEQPGEEQPGEEQPSEEQPDIPPSDDIACSKQEEHNTPIREEEATSTDRAGDETPLDKSTPTHKDVLQVVTSSQSSHEGDDASSTGEEELVMPEGLSEGGGLDEETAGKAVSDKENELAVLDGIETKSSCVLVPVEQEMTEGLADCSTEPSCQEATIQQDDNGLLEVIDIDETSPSVETEQAISEVNTGNGIIENGLSIVDTELVDHPSTEDVAVVDQPAGHPSTEDVALVDQPAGHPSTEDVAMVDQPVDHPNTEDVAMVDQPVDHPSTEDMAVVDQPAGHNEDEDTSIDEWTLVSKTVDIETEPVVIAGRDDGDTESGLTMEESVKEEEEVVVSEIEKKRLEDQAKRDAVKGPRYGKIHTSRVRNKRERVSNVSLPCIRCIRNVTYFLLGN